MNKQEYYHLVGIKGVGMSALAQLLKANGIKITGSDTDEIFITDDMLKNAQIEVFSPFSKSNIKNPDLVVRSSAYGEDHIEISEARRRHIPVITYAEALARLFNKRYGIAVAGTHGKTTITALLGLVLERANLDPTVVVGGILKEFGDSNMRVGKGRYFVLEACEFKNNFLVYKPKMIVIPTIDFDHPDCFKNLDEVKKAFLEFIGNLSREGVVIACFDEQNVKEVALGSKRKVVSYGLSGGVDFQGLDIRSDIYGSSFLVKGYGKMLGKFRIALPGKHNIRNALAVIALSSKLGIRSNIIYELLANHRGVKRRFETLGVRNGIRIMDDFAHHPVEIQVTLASVRQFWPQSRIWAVFQPYTYSRTKSLLQEFSEAFGEADFVVLDDIYPSAREQDTGEVKGIDLYKLTSQKHQDVYFVSGLEKIAEFLKGKVKSGDVVITMGCGDIYKAGELLLKKLSQVHTRTS